MNVDLKRQVAVSSQLDTSRQWIEQILHVAWVLDNDLPYLGGLVHGTQHKEM